MSERYSAIVVGAGGIAGAWFPPLLEENVEILQTGARQIENYFTDRLRNLAFVNDRLYTEYRRTL